MTRRPPRSARQAALQIVRNLRREGFTALFAGGCVRDMLMGHRPSDYDVATDATPEQIIPLFRRTQKVGVQFGVVIVGVGPHWIEVATFRSDLRYEDGRRPAQICYSNPREDALRRDFTINGMFFDPLSREVIDYVGGRRDLEGRLVRAIGEPSRRFSEDHLRLLRAVRFAARLGFRIEPATLTAIKEKAAAIARISPERIYGELQEILTPPTRAAGWAGLIEANLLPHLWQGASHLVDHADIIGKRLAALPRDVSIELSLAAVLLPLPDAEVRAACRALRTSNETRDTTAWLCHHLTDVAEPDRLTLADLKLLMAHESFADLLLLLASDLTARGASLTPHRRLVRRASAIPKNEIAPPPLLTGHDLTAMHVTQGPVFGRILKRVYYAQLNGEIRERAAAKALARHLLEK
jgi:tRNA nucleotidyltransferase/poly(A) polymerase